MLSIKDEILGKIPGGSLRSAIQFLEKLHWFLYVKESEGRILLFMGDRPMFETDSMDAIEAFIYGALVAYRSFPADLFEQFQEPFRNLEKKYGPFKRPSLPGLRPL